MTNRQSGFTLIELMVAIVILTVGLLGLVTSSALVTRLIARGQRSAVATTFATSRLEQLRPAACIPTQRLPGAETLYRGSSPVATNQWTFTDVGSKTYRVRLVTTYRTVQSRVRADTIETAIPCQT